MEDLFRSTRLEYRAVEDTPEDAAFFHRIQSDVAAFANSDSGLLKPMTTKESKAHMDFVANKTLLGVIICLRSGSEQAAGREDGQVESAVTGGQPSSIPIGSIYLTASKLGEVHHRNAYISVDIIAPYQRRGYGSEAIHWVLDWGFRIAGLHRIGIEHYSYNEGAGELYTKLGFTLEGRKREVLWHNGDWHDWLSYSILKSEWEAMEAGKSTAVLD
ncbi:MAG: hypothetical protein MMC23_005931 [Stictis urceolatum]|nr:hypothetical protein [Stictis urceolata]